MSGLANTQGWEIGWKKVRNLKLCSLQGRQHNILVLKKVCLKGKLLDDSQIP